MCMMSHGSRPPGLFVGGLRNDVHPAQLAVSLCNLLAKFQVHIPTKNVSVVVKPHAAYALIEVPDEASAQHLLTELSSPQALQSVCDLSALATDPRRLRVAPRLSKRQRSRSRRRKKQKEEQALTSSSAAGHFPNVKPYPNSYIKGGQAAGQGGRETTTATDLSPPFSRFDNNNTPNNQTSVTFAAEENEHRTRVCEPRRARRRRRAGNSDASVGNQNSFDNGRKNNPPVLINSSVGHDSNNSSNSSDSESSDLASSSGPSASHLPPNSATTLSSVDSAEWLQSQQLKQQLDRGRGQGQGRGGQGQGQDKGRGLVIGLAAAGIRRLTQEHAAQQSLSDRGVGPPEGGGPHPAAGVLQLGQKGRLSSAATSTTGLPLPGSVSVTTSTPGVGTGNAIGFYRAGQDVGRESRHSEFKQGGFAHKDRSWLSETVGKYVCGFLNSCEGGTLYFGVNDQGKVIGFSCRQEQEDDYRLLIDEAIKSIEPSVFTDSYTVRFVPVMGQNGKLCESLNVLEVEVKEIKRPKHLYVFRHNAYLRRDGSLQGPLKARQVQEWTEKRLDRENSSSLLKTHLSQMSTQLETERQRNDLMQKKMTQMEDYISQVKLTVHNKPSKLCLLL